MENVTLTIETIGISKLARHLGVPITTVDYWKSTGRVPSWRRDAFDEAVKSIQAQPAKNTYSEGTSPKGGAA